MRFNKQELATLATQPSNKFDKEGILYITERQEGFFRRAETQDLSETGCVKSSSFFKSKPTRRSVSCIGGTKVSLERWCRLRGNLLFYFRSSDQFSEPQGVIVLEKCEPVIHNDKREQDGFVFFIEFQDNLKQRLATNTESERDSWIGAIRQASYEEMRKKLKNLQEQIERRRDNKQDVDIDMTRLQLGSEIDISEIPVCESAVSCDNLLCDGHGRPPNPSVMVQISDQSRGCWIRYGRTEVIERCSNPQFICTILFRSSDGLNKKSVIRFTIYDVREKMSQTAVPLGSAEITLGVIEESQRLRVPLQSNSGSAGFITITSWSPEQERKYSRSPARRVEHHPRIQKHRRSQSLPPKLGVKLQMPPHMKLSLMFANPTIRTYRLHSGLGGDISVFELMMESRLCFIIPQQLLTIWILREKELLQEISGIGELGGEWRNIQMKLLDKHLKLLNDYSQAKQNLQQRNSNKFFKQSASKGDDSLEFAPVNLHLQRMWAYNDTLKRDGFLDIVTVGAFTRHTGKTKTGGLIKLLQMMKDSPSKVDHIDVKVRTANDAVQSIKQLRKEIVEIMSQLLCLAKMKRSQGMLPLCNEMVTKTRALLNIWEPNLVEEAFTFIEKNRIIDDTSDTSTPMKSSPFRNITQQLGALDLKSPDLEDFATPIEPRTNLWPTQNEQNVDKNRNIVSEYNPNASEIVFDLNSPVTNAFATDNSEIANKDNSLAISETHFDVSGEVFSLPLASNQFSMETKPNPMVPMTQAAALRKRLDDEQKAKSLDFFLDNQMTECRNDILTNSANAEDDIPGVRNCSIALGHNGAFLDTKAMSSSPSANYYRPTEEPEPLDLTQLNIEASVMCLVSKVKFLCGRCGSPAVRLRQPKSNARRGFSQSSTIVSQPLSANSTNTNTNEQLNDQQENPNVTQESNCNIDTKNDSKPGKELNLALNQVVDEVTRKVKGKGNKFTDGLDLSLTTDWASELRPSMRKLRQAMDGLLKTARLMHSVQRLQQDMKKTSANLSTMYRRDVCFSHSLTSIVTGLMAKLWGTNITEQFIQILSTLGPLAYFEGLLSLYGSETDMWGDMCVAIEDLGAVSFTLVRSSGTSNKKKIWYNPDNTTKSYHVPRIIGSRQSMNVLLPVPDYVFALLPKHQTITFRIIPVFFNIGINEYATISETLGYTREQHRSNLDNFDRLKQYFIQYKKKVMVKKSTTPTTPNKNDSGDHFLHVANQLTLLKDTLRKNASKNIQILHLASDICRGLNGIRLTSCKSAKDRTSMAVTLEQCHVLQKEFHLPANDVQKVLNTMRSEGTRSENTFKNIGLRKYAFNLPQVLSLPQIYRPPTGSYGKAQT